ncbi:MAG TPA: hypothetical protein VIM28_02855 [Solirubrobacterales bacterium]
MPIDFVCGPREQIDAVEVADWARLDRRKAKVPGRSLPGRPAVVASRDELDFGKSANVIPAVLLLWALSDWKKLGRRWRSPQRRPPGSRAIPAEGA